MMSEEQEQPRIDAISREDEELPYDERSGIYARISPTLDDALRIAGTEVFGRKRGYLKNTLKEAFNVWLVIAPHRQALLERGDSLPEIILEAINLYLNQDPIPED